MARINIEDLPQSEDLDREAMRRILGGGPTPSPFKIDEGGVGGGRILEYPPGFRRQKPAPTRS